jgi:hypothetical protein
VGRQADRIEVMAPAVVASDRLAPQSLEDLDRFFSRRAAPREVGSHERKLLRSPTDAHAEDEALLRKDLHGRDLLDHQDRVALRQD